MPETRRIHEPTALYALAEAQSVLGEMIVLTEAERPVYWNDALRVLTGFSNEEIGSLVSFYDLIAADARAELLRAVVEQRAKRISAKQETVLVRKDGARVEIECAVSVLGDGPPERVVIVARDISARTAGQRALERQALFDALTDLPNRSLLLDRLQQAIVGAHRVHGTAALLLMDLDGFKEVNDSFGHHVGDALLRQVGKRLTLSLREIDTVARLGGDEFAVVLPGGDATSATLVADKILRAFEPLFMVDGRPLHVGASIGVAVAPEHGDDPGTLLRRADVAMYEAKDTKGTRRIYTASMDEESAKRRLQLEELRHAIGHRQFVLQYQPKLDAATMRVTGVEALVRWQHPDRGLLAPAEFLPAAEQSAVGKTLGLWVIREALAQCRAWRMAGFDLPVAVNLGMQVVQDPRLPDLVSEMLTATDVPADRLQLEITEGAAMNDAAAVVERLRRLHDLGVRISIDDFGTGYSSLAYLQKLPVSELKIDRSFVTQMMSQEADAIIVRSSINLAHDLGLAVVGEGVEDRATGDRLRELGCDVVQGFIFGRPMSLLDLIRWFGDSAHGLAGSEEAQQRHAMSFVAFAEEALAATLRGERQVQWSEQLEAEHDNIKIALDWALHRGDASSALRLGAALRLFWVDRGHVVEGCAFLEGALAAPGAQARSIDRANALAALGMLRAQQGVDMYPDAHRHLAEAIGIYRETLDFTGLAKALNNLGVVANFEKDFATSDACYTECFSIRKTLGDRTGQATALNNLAINTYHRGDNENARRWAREALELYREGGERRGMTDVLDTLAAIAIEEDDVVSALAYYREGLELYRDLTTTGDLAHPLIGVGLVAAATGAPLVALKLAGAVATLREQSGGRRAIHEDLFNKRISEIERTTLEEECQAAIAQGRALSRDESIAYALAYQIGSATAV